MPPNAVPVTRYTSAKNGGAWLKHLGNIYAGQGYLTKISPLAATLLPQVGELFLLIFCLFSFTALLSLRCSQFNAYGRLRGTKSSVSNVILTSQSCKIIAHFQVALGVFVIA